MQRNNVDKARIPENQLLLYVSDQPPDEDWSHVATNFNWQILHHSDLFPALGAFVMLMPGIVIIDRRSTVGDEALPHIEDILPTMPQPLLVIIELGVPDCIARYGSVIRLGALVDTSPGALLSQIDNCF